jgi:hypothetical protein
MVKARRKGRLLRLIKKPRSSEGQNGLSQGHDDWSTFLTAGGNSSANEVDDAPVDDEFRPQADLEPRRLVFPFRVILFFWSSFEVNQKFRYIFKAVRGLDYHDG